MPTCRCGAQCRGGLCKQCEIEESYEHLRDDSGSRWASGGDDEEGGDE